MSQNQLNFAVSGVRVESGSDCSAKGSALPDGPIQMATSGLITYWDDSGARGTTQRIQGSKGQHIGEVSGEGSVEYGAGSRTFLPCVCVHHPELP